jgi:hypothetical protein
MFVKNVNLQVFDEVKMPRFWINKCYKIIVTIEIWMSFTICLLKKEYYYFEEKIFI